MASTTHTHPNYMGIFWVLLVLTVIEVALTFVGLPKLLLGSLLVILAVWKAALVAMYFMHLKFERRTLAMIAVVPFILCLFFILMLLPDIGPA
jgi:cytochrome c oxidase subunit IV